MGFGSLNAGSPGQWYQMGQDLGRAPYLSQIAQGQQQAAQRANTQNTMGQLLGMAGQFIMQKKQMDMMGNVTTQNQPVKQDFTTPEYNKQFTEPVKLPSITDFANNNLNFSPYQSQPGYNFANPN